MKKILSLIFIIIFLLSFVGCAGEKSVEADVETEDTAPLANTTANTLNLHMQMTDEEGSPCAADSVTITTQEGTVYTAQVSGGECTVEGLPCTQKMSGVLTLGASRVGSFQLSLWTGFELGFHNNLSFMSIDIPGNISELFLKVTVRRDVEKVICTYISQYSFEETEPDESTTDIGEDTAAATGLYGVRYVAETGLNLRAEPSTESASLTKLNFADQLTLMNNGEEVDGELWYKVQIGEQEGYVSGAFVGKRYTITKNGVNVRTEPSTDGEVKNMIGAGTVVIALGEGTQDGDYQWFHIKTRGGLEGYVRNDFMTMA